MLREASKEDSYADITVASETTVAGSMSTVSSGGTKELVIVDVVVEPLTVHPTVSWQSDYGGPRVNISQLIVPRNLTLPAYPSACTPRCSRWRD